MQIRYAILRIISLLFVESSTFVNCIFSQFRVTKILKSRHFFSKKINIALKRLYEMHKKVHTGPIFWANNVKEIFLILFISSHFRPGIFGDYKSTLVPALGCKFCPRPASSPSGRANSVPAPPRPCRGVQTLSPPLPGGQNALPAPSPPRNSGRGTGIPAGRVLESPPQYIHTKQVHQNVSLIFNLRSHS